VVDTPVNNNKSAKQVRPRTTTLQTQALRFIGDHLEFLFRFSEDQTLILLSLTLQAAVPTVVSRTLQSETSDGYVLACTVANSDWKMHRVELVQTGGRAYVASDGEGKPEIYRTHSELRVTADETGQLLGMSVSRQLIDRPGYGYATVPIDIGGEKGRAKITVSEVSAKQFAITIVRINGSETNPFAGLCHVNANQQLPLTEAETRDYIRNPYGLPNR